MRARQSPNCDLPDLWLISDERNDDRLEVSLRALPRGSGFIYRHYHLPPRQRVARWFSLREVARARGHLAILSDSSLTALEWGADGIYGAPLSLWPTRNLIMLAAAHDLAEIAMANRKNADAVLISPVFPTRSHPGLQALGPARFRLLAEHARMPAIALGGMNRENAARLRWRRWAAIDGLS